MSEHSDATDLQKAFTTIRLHLRLRHQLTRFVRHWAVLRIRETHLQCRYRTGQGDRKGDSPLGVAFIDLGAEFATREGGICAYLSTHRYETNTFARAPEREEEVIRTRFPIYLGLPARRLETMQPIDAVVDELARAGESPC